MKIIINATNLRLGGSVQVCISILEELRFHQEHEYHVFLSPHLSGLLNLDRFPANFSVYHFNSYPLSGIWNAFFFKQKLSALEKKIKPDFVFSVFGPVMWRPRAPHLSGFANVILFDEAAYTKRVIKTNPVKAVKYKLRRYLTLRQVTNEADIFWLETETARNKLSDSTGIDKANISVISNNYASYFEHSYRETTQNEPFRFLYLSSYYHHKNFEIFKELIPLLKTEGIRCLFYLTIKDTDFCRLFPEKQDMIENLGPVRPQDCPELYNKVDAVFFPSMLEFFTAAFPEAMVMRKPIVCGDLDFAHDICGDAAIYFNPFEARSASKAIKTVMQNEDLRERLKQNGIDRLKRFDSASQRAQKLLNIMKDYLNRDR